jgi:hypothetical protein
VDYFFFLVDPMVVVPVVLDVEVAVVPDVVVAVVDVIIVPEVSVMLPDGIADVLVMLPAVSVVDIEPVVSVVVTVEVMAVSVVAVSVVTVSSFLHPKANIVIAASASRVIVSFFMRKTLLLNGCFQVGR